MASENKKSMERQALASKLKESSKTFWDEFREFAFKGNVIELAIGVVIGSAFNNLVQSLVNNIIMPPIGRLLGDTKFVDLFINLSSVKYKTLAEAEAAAVPVIKYGHFLSNLMDFLIMAFTIFLVIKYILKFQNKKDKSI